MILPATARAGRGLRSVSVGKDDLRPPVEFADAVEMYAREHDRHGTLKFEPRLNVWVIEFTLKAGDPRLRAWQEGMATEEPKEVIQLWDYLSDAPRSREHIRIKEHRRDAMKRGLRLNNYVGYTLAELGVSGMIAFLEEGNTWGRGQYKSHEAAVIDQNEKRIAGEIATEANARQNAVDRGMESRRKVLGIPMKSVGIDLQSTPESASGDGK